MPSQLIVMRHGKAEPYAATDQARALTARGCKEARDAASHLVGAGLAPGCALVSPAVRTRQTWEEVASAWETPPQPVYDARLYSGGVDELLDLLREVPQQEQVVMLVGHNPAAATLVHTLDDGRGDNESVDALLRGFPTAAVAVLDMHVPWAEVGEQTARVCTFHAPRA